MSTITTGGCENESVSIHVTGGGCSSYPTNNPETTEVTICMAAAKQELYVM